MRILKKFVKKLYHLIWFLSLFLLFLIPVNAELDTQFELKIFNRSYQQLPFTTGYSVGEVTYYTNEVKVYGTNANLVNLPRYLYFIYCATGSLDINTTYIYRGDISHNGYTRGGSCRVYDSGNYYPGYYYLDRWTIDSWSDYSASGIYEYGVQWRGYPINQESYYVFIRGESMFLSNELITDFSADYILNQLISSNGSINNNITSIKQDTNSLKQGQNEIKQKQDQTNQKLDDIDDTLKDDNVSSSDDTLSDLKDDLPTNSVISDLLLLPIRLLQNIVNALGGTCASFNLGSLYGTNLIMPCINIQQYVGSTIWSFIDLVFSGMFVLVIRKKFIEIWENITNLRNGGNEVD